MDNRHKPTAIQQSRPPRCFHFRRDFCAGTPKSKSLVEAGAGSPRTFQSSASGLVLCRRNNNWVQSWRPKMFQSNGIRRVVLTCATNKTCHPQENESYSRLSLWRVRKSRKSKFVKLLILRNHKSRESENSIEKTKKNCAKRRNFSRKKKNHKLRVCFTFPCCKFDVIVSRFSVGMGKADRKVSKS